jgi:hypothetical protein
MELHTVEVKIFGDKGVIRKISRTKELAVVGWWMWDLCGRDSDALSSFPMIEVCQSRRRKSVTDEQGGWLDVPD